MSPDLRTETVLIPQKFSSELSERTEFLQWLASAVGSSEAWQLENYSDGKTVITTTVGVEMRNELERCK